MRIALHASSPSATAGGSVSYILHLASALQRRHEVTLFASYEPDPGVLERFLPDLHSIPEIRPTPDALNIRLVGEAQRALEDWPFDAVVVQSSWVPRYLLNRKAYLLCEFPFATHLPWDDRLRLRSFSAVIANSRFTAEWIDRRWGRQAQVLYPAVPTIERRPKTRTILSIGRFREGGRSKQQAVLVEIFRQLVASGITGWTLHLAGFVEDAAYFERVRAAAADLPVVLHPGADRGQLERLVSEASIYWHAVGLDADEEQEPHRMEHFGIATVEAMSAGTVPVVLARGGQVEIVEDQRSGLHWRDPEQCFELTRALIDDGTYRAALSRGAEERARRFGIRQFEQAVHNLF